MQSFLDLQYGLLRQPILQLLLGFLVNHDEFDWTAFAQSLLNNRWFLQPSNLLYLLGRAEKTAESEE